MKAIVKIILKSKAGKAVLSLLIEHFTLKLIEKMKRKNTDLVAVHIFEIGVNEFKNEVIEEIIKEV